MLLPVERIGPYLRALHAGLTNLAPHGDYPPLPELLVLLEALDPDCSGTLLLPAEIDPRAGLPALPWLERARAEADQAHPQRPDLDDREIERAYALDRALGARLEARRRLHRLLRHQAPLPGSRLDVVLERLDTTARFGISFDHMPAGGGWERIRVSLEQPRSRSGAGAIEATDPLTPLRVHPGLRHLLARHAPTPLVSLHAQLAEILESRVLRLSRSRVGPFWFRGVPLPPDAPSALAGGLVLHLSSEVVGEDVRASRHLDPWLAPPDGELLPRRCQVYRERRFCASPALMPVLERWGHERGIPALTCPLTPHPAERRRSL